MTTIRQETQRKRELLARYRELRRAELLEELREQAAEEAEGGRYPWRGEFRSQAEILELYRRRRRWNLRFFIDVLLLCALCGGALYAGQRLVEIVSPGSSFQED